MQWKIELREKNTSLGVLTCYDIDQPWYLCIFEPTKAFQQVKHLFDALKEEEAGNQDFLDADEAIQELGLELVSLDSNLFNDKERTNDFLLYIQGKDAQFRY